MKVEYYKIDSAQEVIVKIVKEAFALFKITFADDPASPDGPCDYASISIVNDWTEGNAPLVRTKVAFGNVDGTESVYEHEAWGRADERPRAAVHRLVKRNLFYILQRVVPDVEAPWGILHGVRPTKMVHSLIDRGLGREEIAARLEADYFVKPKKSRLITELAFWQRPFLANPDPRRVGVYIGIPFCLSRCLYCSFPSYVLPPDDVLRRFLAALRRDMLAARELIDVYGLQVESVYIGGGTPTSLPDAAFETFLEDCVRLFCGGETREFTVEAGRPDSVNDAKIEAMLRAGVDRVSVNPQTMQEKTLKRIGRKHTPGDIIELFGKFKRAGMRAINMDLIVGLPGETCADMEDTMQKIGVLQPENVTLHTLAMKRGSALKTNREAYDLPDDRIAADMYDIAARHVSSWGMHPYYLYRQGYMSGNLQNIGYCHFGFEGLYNLQIMEERQTILGIGAAATTKLVDLPNHRLETAFHPKDLTTYLDNLDRYTEKRAALFRHREELFL